MKICWDNLEKLEYRYDRSDWQDKKWINNFYIYKDSCKNCGDPFLTQKGSKNIFCDVFCKNNGHNHPMFGKHHSEKSKEKMRKSVKVRFENPENNPNWKGGITESNLPFYDGCKYNDLKCKEKK